METITAIYFCGISKKWHLDEAKLVQREYVAQAKAVKVGKLWKNKVATSSRISLGSNIGVFLTRDEAVSYSLKVFGRIAFDFDFNIVTYNFVDEVMT
jgi:hypothetical protein